MWPKKYVTHGCFSFQRTTLYTRLTTEHYRLKRIMRSTIRLVLMFFYSLLIIVPLVMKRYEEILVIYVFLFTKV
jgi:hypothetical protein